MRRSSRLRVKHRTGGARYEACREQSLWQWSVRRGQAPRAAELRPARRVEGRGSGTGVSAKVVEYYRKLNNQEVRLLREQLRELRGAAWSRGGSRAKQGPRAKQGFRAKPGARAKPRAPLDEETRKIIARIEERIDGWVNRPACASLAEIVVVEVTVAPDAEPGAREIRLFRQTYAARLVFVLIDPRGEGFGRVSRNASAGFDDSRKPQFVHDTEQPGAGQSNRLFIGDRL